MRSPAESPSAVAFADPRLGRLRCPCLAVLLEVWNRDPDSTRRQRVARWKIGFWLTILMLLVTAALFLWGRLGAPTLHDSAQRVLGALAQRVADAFFPGPFPATDANRWTFILRWGVPAAVLLALILVVRVVVSGLALAVRAHPRPVAAIERYLDHGEADRGLVSAMHAAYRQCAPAEMGLRDEWPETEIGAYLASAHPLHRESEWESTSPEMRCLAAAPPSPPGLMRIGERPGGAAGSRFRAEDVRRPGLARRGLTYLLCLALAYVPMPHPAPSLRVIPDPEPPQHTVPDPSIPTTPETDLSKPSLDRPQAEDGVTSAFVPPIHGAADLNADALAAELGLLDAPLDSASDQVVQDGEPSMADAQSDKDSNEFQPPLPFDDPRQTNIISRLMKGSASTAEVHDALGQLQSEKARLETEAEDLARRADRDRVAAAEARERARQAEAEARRAEAANQHDTARQERDKAERERQEAESHESEAARKESESNKKEDEAVKLGAKIGILLAVAAISPTLAGILLIASLFGKGGSGDGGKKSGEGKDEKSPSPPTKQKGQRESGGSGSGSRAGSSDATGESEATTSDQTSARQGLGDGRHEYDPQSGSIYGRDASTGDEYLVARAPSGLTAERLRLLGAGDRSHPYADLAVDGEARRFRPDGDAKGEALGISTKSFAGTSADAAESFQTRMAALLNGRRGHVIGSYPSVLGGSNWFIVTVDAPQALYWLEARTSAPRTWLLWLTNATGLEFAKGLTRPAEEGSYGPLLRALSTNSALPQVASDLGRAVPHLERITASSYRMIVVEPRDPFSSAAMDASGSLAWTRVDSASGARLRAVLDPYSRGAIEQDGVLTELGVDLLLGPDAGRAVSRQGVPMLPELSATNQPGWVIVGAGLAGRGSLSLVLADAATTPGAFRYLPPPSLRAGPRRWSAIRKSDLEDRYQRRLRLNPSLYRKSAMPSRLDVLPAKAWQRVFTRWTQPDNAAFSDFPAWQGAQAGEITFLFSD